MTRIPEEFVKERTQGKLAELGYTRLNLRSAGSGGPDIVVRHRTHNVAFVIECKGESGAVEEHTKSAVMDTNILVALGQILIRFTVFNGKKYGLAFPATFRHRVLGKLSPAVVARLRLNLFFVSKDGRVEHLSPTEAKRLTLG
ncbi:MAG TPA: hypothetical protein VMH38_00870 [Thermoplasmata archaeon]|nr:hypothetical protein [Thermoplasmata archaeon]